MADLIQPKDIKVACADGTEKTFIISKFGAVAGRELVAKYPLSALPKLGDYAVNEETMLKLMSYVAVPMDSGQPLRLSSRVFIDNHVDSWETLAKLEYETMQYNCSFFLKDVALTFFDALVRTATSKITSILTASSQPSSSPVKPPSTN